MKSIKQHSTEEVEQVQRIQNGDKKVFSDLYISNFSQMCDFIFSITNDEEVSKELVQDVFLSIWMNRRNWQPKGTIHSYLYRSVKNRAFDYLKHRKVEWGWQKKNQVSNPFFSETPHDQYTQVELESIIQNAIDELPEKRKMIYILSRVQGLKYREIADIMDISEKTVENQMGSALRKLRLLVKKYL